jgi:mono/diheme cytochrome c family protein
VRLSITPDAAALLAPAILSLRNNRPFNLSVSVTRLPKEARMKARRRKLGGSAFAISIMAAWLLVGTISVQASPEAIESGREEFNSVCALCHGENAKGTGPLAKLLINGAPDLTLLAKKNKGAFPFSMIVDVIEGRAASSGHGIREMPVWGRTFRQEEARGKILDILLTLRAYNPGNSSPIRLRPFTTCTQRDREFVGVDELIRVFGPLFTQPL